MRPPGRARRCEFRATQIADLTALTQFLDRTCRQAGADDDTLFAVRLAVEEVFTNIVQYGYGNRPGPVSIGVDIEPERITITLVDAAAAFDPAAVAQPDLAADWNERRIGGLGWHFVHQLMDEVRWTAGAHGGNVFTLIKLFPGASRPG